jgi:hypothetical protein
MMQIMDMTEQKVKTIMMNQMIMGTMVVNEHDMTMMLMEI